MSVLHLDGKADGTNVEHDVIGSKGIQPTFDVIGLLKEGSASAALSGKGNAEALGSTATSSGMPASNNFETKLSSSPQPIAIMANSDHSGPEHDECVGGVGFTLLAPAAIGGLLGGAKLGAEAGFLVAGPAGVAPGAVIGMAAGVIAGDFLSFYTADRGCNWVEDQIDKDNQNQFYRDEGVMN